MMIGVVVGFAEQHDGAARRPGQHIAARHGRLDRRVDPGSGLDAGDGFSIGFRIVRSSAGSADGGERDNRQDGR